MVRVLIVDDEKSIGMVLTDYLEEQGHKIETAESLAEARISLQHHTPDVILLDAMLPDGNGMMLLKDLRDDGSEVPIIIMSAHQPTYSDQEKGKAMGVDDYLNKPFDLKELERRLEKFGSKQ